MVCLRFLQLLFTDILLIGLMLFLSGPFAIAKSSCDPKLALKELFNRDRQSYTYQNLWDELPYSKLDYDAKVLGKGKDGVAILITPKAHPEKAFVVKRMEKSTALHDYAVFKLLKEALADNLSISVAEVKILPSKYSGYLFLQTKYVRGPSLFRWLENPSISPERKSLMRAKFHQAMQTLSEELEMRNHFELTGKEPKGYYFPSQLSRTVAHRVQENQPLVFTSKMPINQYFDVFHPEFPRRVKILKRIGKIDPGNLAHLQVANADLELTLKSDNIQVTETDELVLVDPN